MDKKRKLDYYRAKEKEEREVAFICGKIYYRNKSKWGITTYIHCELVQWTKDQCWKVEWSEAIAPWLCSIEVFFIDDDRVVLDIGKEIKISSEQGGSWHIENCEDNLTLTERFIYLYSRLADQFASLHKLPFNLWVTLMIKIQEFIYSYSPYEELDPPSKVEDNAWHVKPQHWHRAIAHLFASPLDSSGWIYLKWPSLIIPLKSWSQTHVQLAIEKEIILHTFFALYSRCYPQFPSEWLASWKLFLSGVSLVNDIFDSSFYWIGGDFCAIMSRYGSELPEIHEKIDDYFTQEGYECKISAYDFALSKKFSHQSVQLVKSLIFTTIELHACIEKGKSYAEEYLEKHTTLGLFASTLKEIEESLNFFLVRDISRMIVDYCRVEDISENFLFYSTYKTQL